MSQTTARNLTAAPSCWSIDDAATLYGVDRWGGGYFAVNDAGHAVVQPGREDSAAGARIDLKRLVDELQQRGIALPVLLRFSDVLADRLRQLTGAFRQAIDEFDYDGDYCGVYPIKVNQQRHVVEEIVHTGRSLGMGVEAGSKPELLALLALVSDDSMPIICNGFKDDEFIEAVVLAMKIGKCVIPIVEQLAELKRIMRYAQRHEVRPMIGLRVKVDARGAGRWERSAGARSKFGLMIWELLEAIEMLREHGMADCVNLLHFHLGSQINDIGSVKSAVIELARVYVDMQRLGANVAYLDVGGGLGVDYDGSRTASDSSVNYTLQEYANDVVYHIKQVCDEAGAPHPTIMSESGRAIIAYHSVLVVNVLGRDAFTADATFAHPLDDDARKKLPTPVATLLDSYANLNEHNHAELYHDAVLARDQVMSLFNLGYCTLEHRSLAQRLYLAIAGRVLDLTRDLPDRPRELAHLEHELAETYFCNCSVFQSLPDSWAINQVFPVMPIHRLDERPTRRGVIADITCDSDGRIDNFIGPPGTPGTTRHTLDLHDDDGQPYYLGVFLVGAYQETLGDLHNLLGDTHAVHVSLDEQGQTCIDEVVEGNTVREVLEYVQFSANELKRAMRKRIELALRDGKISLDQSHQLRRFYEAGLEGYTYMK